MPENTAALAAALERYLGCPCRFFAPAADDAHILAAYRAARERGGREGFVPMLVSVSSTLQECLFANADPDWRGGDIDLAKVKAYREEALAAPLREGDAAARELMDARREEAEAYGLPWDEIGEVSGGDALTSFIGYRDYSARKTCPLLLAEIPAERPWEVFAYLPFGGWNECPDTRCLMEMSKYWFERYGAVPAVMTSDVLEYAVPVPVKREDAVPLAREQYAFCGDIVDQGVGSVGALADGLAKSTDWFFWWD